LSSTATGPYGTGYSYVLGLSGYVESYILSGKTPTEYSAIKTQLLAELNITDGSFNIYAGTDDGIKQSAAYALKALNHTTTDMTGTVNYLVNSQSAGGIWIENDGSENTEVESEILTALVSIDTTKPVITLLGSSSVTIEAGSVYTDAGATALDNYDGVLTSSIVTTGLPIDTNVLGTNTVTYDVTDSNGLAATQVTRTVTVSGTLPSIRYINGTVNDSLYPFAAIPDVTVTTGSLTTKTNPAGFYSFGVSEGAYSLNASLNPTYYPNSSIPVSTVGKLVAVQNIKLVLKPVGNITGNELFG